MTCQDARAWLSDLLDEALGPERRGDVEAHLAGCAECRFELDHLRATVLALQGLERPRAPVGFVDRVVRRVYAGPWHRRLGAWMFLPLSVKLPAEAAAVVVIAGLAMLVWERTPELRDVARQEPAPPSAPAVEPTPRAESPAPPAPSSAATTRPSKPARGKAEERPAPTEPAAPATPGESTVSAPSAPEAKAESEERVVPPPPAAPSRSSAAQSDRSEARTRSASPAVQRTLAPVPSASDVGWRLIVRDRDGALVAIAELLLKLGGQETARRPDASDTVLDVQIAQARYDDFMRDLARLGWLTTSGRPNVLPLDPPQVRLTIRLEVRP